MSPLFLLQVAEFGKAQLAPVGKDNMVWGA